MKSIMSSDDESMLPPAKIIKVEGKLKELVGGGGGEVRDTVTILSLLQVPKWRLIWRELKKKLSS